MELTTANVEDIAPSLYKEFGAEACGRMLPYLYDGLRPSERRVLLAAYEKARDKFKKSRVIDAHASGVYHPHSGLYNTIVQLGRNKELLHTQGNFGSLIGIDQENAAADRYTECKISDFTINLALKLKKFAPHKQAEVDSEYQEPKYLPTMFPICFVGHRTTEGIAFGYKAEIPTYNINDLYERLISLISKNKQKPVIKPLTECEILSDESKLENLLSTGREKIYYKGIYEVDRENKKIHIRSFPPNKRFETIWKKFAKEANNRDIGYSDMSSNKTGGTDVVIQVLKNRNSAEILDRVVNKLDKQLISSESFDVIVVDNNLRPQRASVDDMLLACYNTYLKHTKEMLKERIEHCSSLIDEYESLKILRPVLSNYLTKHTIKNVSKAIKDLTKESQLKESMVKHLLQKYRIGKLLTLDTDTSKLEKDKEQYEKYLKRPTNYIKKDYKNLLEMKK